MAPNSNRTHRAAASSQNSQLSLSAAAAWQSFYQTVDALWCDICAPDTKGPHPTPHQQLHQLLAYPSDILPKFLVSLIELETYNNQQCDREVNKTHSDSTAVIDKAKQSWSAVKLFCQSEQARWATFEFGGFLSTGS